MDEPKNSAPKLSRVIRLDSLPVNSTYFTEEGYLVDNPPGAAASRGSLQA